MEAFFSKYPMSANEGTAISMIHRQIEKAKACYKKDKKGTEYLKEMAKVYAMLDDFFEEKGIDPATLL